MLPIRRVIIVHIISEKSWQVKMPVTKGRQCVCVSASVGENVCACACVCVFDNITQKCVDIG